MIGYIFVWAGTTCTFFLGFVCGKPWLDRKLAQKPAPKPQQGVTAP